MTECADISVEPAFDFEAVTITECDCRPPSGRPDESFTVEAMIQNDNPVDVIADVGWFASDLSGGPGVARLNDVFIGDESTQGVLGLFTPNDVPEIVDAVGEDGEWASTIEAFIIPGSVEEAGGFGISRSRDTTEQSPTAMTDGGCTSCGGRAPARATSATAAEVSCGQTVTISEGDQPPGGGGGGPDRSTLIVMAVGVGSSFLARRLG